MEDLGMARLVIGEKFVYNEPDHRMLHEVDASIDLDEQEIAGFGEAWTYTDLGEPACIYGIVAGLVCRDKPFTTIQGIQSQISKYKKITGREPSVWLVKDTEIA